MTVSGARVGVATLGEDESGVDESGVDEHRVSDNGVDKGMFGYGIPSVMKLWQGLKLERLVVVVESDSQLHEGGIPQRNYSIGAVEGDEYWDLGWTDSQLYQFATAGKGWKELVFRVDGWAWWDARAAAIALGRLRRAMREREIGGTVEAVVTCQGEKEVRVGEEWGVVTCQGEKEVRVEEEWGVGERRETVAGYSVTTVRRGDGVDVAEDCEMEEETDRWLLEMLRSKGWKQIREEGLCIE